MISELEAAFHVPCLFKLFADHDQVYLQDEQAEEETPDNWGDQLTTRMIAVAPGLLGIGTTRNTTVAVSVEWFDGEPDDPFTGWDQVAEAGLEVPSGRMVIAGGSASLPDATRLSVPPRLLSGARLFWRAGYAQRQWPERRGPLSCASLACGLSASSHLEKMVIALKRMYFQKKEHEKI